MAFGSIRSTRILGMARLAFALMLLLVALLNVLPAPTYFFWQLSILTQEAGHLLALLPLLVLLPGWRRTRVARASVAVAAAACILFLSPLMRAVPAAKTTARQLPAQGEAERALVLRVSPLLIGSLCDRVEPRSLTYATRSDAPILLDLYRTRSRQRAPIVIVVHGGAWRAGNREQLAHLNSCLAQQGYAVAAIDYRLAPVHPYPAAAEDVRAAIAFVQANAHAWQADSSRIALLGRSAGGHLALLTAYTSANPAIRGVVSYYGPTDLRWDWEHPTNPRVIDSHAVLSGFLGGSLDLRGAVYDAASPVRHAGTAVPTLLIHGGADELVFDENSEMLADTLRARGGNVTYIRLPWATHGCDYFLGGPCGQISTWAVERFLEQVMDG